MAGFFFSFPLDTPAYYGILLQHRPGRKAGKADSGMTKGGKTLTGRGTVAGPIQGLLSRLETFVNSEICMLERNQDQLQAEDRDQAGRVFHALLKTAEEAGLLADNGRMDTWSSMFSRYYRFMDTLEAKGRLVKIQVAPLVTRHPGKVKATWCQCGNVNDGPMLEDGACTCGIHKHHVHCMNCGGVTQVG